MSFVYHFYCQYECIRSGEINNLQLFLEKERSLFPKKEVPTRRVLAAAWVIPPTEGEEEVAPRPVAKKGDLVPRGGRSELST